MGLQAEVNMVIGAVLTQLVTAGCFIWLFQVCLNVKIKVLKSS